MLEWSASWKGEDVPHSLKPEIYLGSSSGAAEAVHFQNGAISDFLSKL